MLIFLRTAPDYELINVSPLLVNPGTLLEAAMTAQKDHSYIHPAKLLEVSFDATKDGICVLDPDFNILRVNRTMREWYKNKHCIEGGKCFQVFMNRDEPCGKCPSLTALKTGKPAVEKISFSVNREQCRWIELYAYPLCDEKGNIGGIVEYVRDITEDLIIRQALEDSEEKYRALVEQSIEMIYLHELDGSITEVNRAAAEWTGYSREELGRMSVFDLHPEGHPGVEIKEDIIRQWQNWEPQSGAHNVETVHRRKDGTVIPVSVNTGKVLVGEKAMILALVRDRSEQLQAEEALQYQYRFESMIADISSNFVNASAEDIDRAIDHALVLSGKFFDADRSYICRFSEDGLYMDNTHEWCAQDIDSMKERNQGFALDNAPWWAEQLRQGNYVYVPDVDVLPPEAEKDKLEFKTEKTKSFLSIPMIKDDKVIGLYGFKAVKEKRTLSEQQIDLLKVVADLITGALVKYESEEALKESEERYREILATMEEGYYEADLAGNITYCNEAACRLFGYEPGELIGMSYKQLYRDHDLAYKTFNRVFMTGKPERGLILQMYRRDGTLGYGELSITLIRDKEGYLTGFKGIGKDVTERIQYEQRLEYLSLYDQLTDIFNRAYFEAELKRLNDGRHYPVTIISADLDGLKLVNDTMGHDAGDRLLNNCARVIKDSLRSSDVLARVGGDEFSAILIKTGRETGEKILRRIRENVEEYNRDNEELPLGVSLGVATTDDPGVSLKKLYKRADDMMYRDKLYSNKSSRSKIVQSLLAALAERDYITEGHARRLENLCRAVGEKINLSSHQLADLALLAQVHDLGKVGIPDQILFKPGPLSEEEWEIMRGHPEKGYRIATSSPDLAAVADLILKHHERWDGKGYPLGLSAIAIPVECRILAVVDAFDAMTNKRPYNKTMTREEAIQELKDNAGTQFDPELVQVFIAMLGEDENEKY